MPRVSETTLLACAVPVRVVLCSAALMMLSVATMSNTGGFGAVVLTVSVKAGLWPLWLPAASVKV